MAERVTCTRQSDTLTHVIARLDAVTNVLWYERRFAAPDGSKQTELSGNVLGAACHGTKEPRGNNLPN